MGDWFTILYKREILYDDVFIFIPQHVINGSYDSKDGIFIGDHGNLYASSSDFSVVNSCEVLTHYYPIHMDDVRDMYKAQIVGDEDYEEILVSADECAGKWFNDIKKSILIGKLSNSKKIVEFISMPYEKWAELTERPCYVIDDNEGKVILSRTALESLLLDKDVNKINDGLGTMIKHIDSLEKMHELKGVNGIQMSVDNRHFTNFALEGGAQPETKTREKGQAELSEDFATPQNAFNKTGDYSGVLRYIKERMVLPKNSDLIENILVQIIGNLEADNPEEINRIFSVGPTGTGKSYIYKLLGKILDVPVIIEDCNGIVQEGYVGTSVEDLITKIYFQCGSSIARAERAIIYLDEIDKIASRGSSVSDLGAQSSLLKFIEGAKYTVTIDKAKGTKVTIDSSMMTICAGGAFSEFTYEKKNIGFNSTSDNQPKKCPDISDFIKYGMLPELMGRYSSFIYYDNYTNDEFKQVLLESADSPLLIKQHEYERRFGVKLIAKDDYFDVLANEAYAKKTGFRGIKLVVNTTLLPAQRKLQFGNDKYTELIIDGKTVVDPQKEYVLK